MEIMAEATNVIAEGEVLQLMNAHDPDTTEQRYLEVIYRKTAKLFEAGAEVAAVLAGSPRAGAHGARRLRPTSRHRLPARRRRARLPLQPGRARQEPRRRPRRGQADPAADPCAAARQRAAARRDPARPSSNGGLAQLEPIDRRHRGHRRPRIRGAPGAERVASRRWPRSTRLPDSSYKERARRRWRGSRSSTRPERRSAAPAGHAVTGAGARPATRACPRLRHPGRNGCHHESTSSCDPDSPAARSAPRQLSPKPPKPPPRPRPSC